VTNIRPSRALFHLLHGDFRDGHGWGCSTLAWGYGADHLKSTILSNRSAGTLATLRRVRDPAVPLPLTMQGPWIREGAPQIQRERERAAARPLLLSLLSVHVFFFQLEVAELRSSFPIFSRSCILRRNITVGACMPLPLLQLREIALHTPLCSFFTTSHHSHAHGM
jgi:hypothetical protein